MPDLHRKKLCLTFCDDEHYNATVQVVTLHPGVTFTSWVRSLWNLWALEAQEGQRSELLPLADGQSESALAQLALELGRTARLAAWRWGVGMDGIFTERHGKCVIGQDWDSMQLLFHFLQMETKVMEHARTIWGLKQLVLELSVFWLHIRSLTVLKMHDGNLRTVRGGLCSFETLFFGSQITEHQGMVSDRSTLSWTDMNTFVYGQFFLHTTVLARPQFKLVTFVHE